MKLVAENINEAIKHLQGRTDAELDLPPKVAELIKFFIEKNIPYNINFGPVSTWIDAGRWNVRYYNNVLSILYNNKALKHTELVDTVKSFFERKMKRHEL